MAKAWYEKAFDWVVEKAKSLGGEAEDVYKRTMHKEPDPLPGAPSKLNKLAYYRFHIRGYERLLREKRKEMDPLEKKVAELEREKESLEAGRLDRLARLREIKEQLRRQRRLKRFFAKGTYFRMEHEANEASLEIELSTTAKSPDKRLVELDLRIRASLSELAPLRKEAEHYAEHLSRSENKLNELLEAEKEEEDDEGLLEDEDSEDDEGLL